MEQSAAGGSQGRGPTGQHSVQISGGLTDRLAIQSCCHSSIHIKNTGVITFMAIALFHGGNKSQRNAIACCLYRYSRATGVAIYTGDPYLPRDGGITQYYMSRRYRSPVATGALEWVVAHVYHFEREARVRQNQIGY